VRTRISVSDACTVRANDRATRENRFPPTEIARNTIYFLFVGYLQTVGDLAPANRSKIAGDVTKLRSYH